MNDYFNRLNEIENKIDKNINLKKKDKLSIDEALEKILNQINSYLEKTYDEKFTLNLF